MGERKECGEITKFGSELMNTGTVIFWSGLAVLVVGVVVDAGARAVSSDKAADETPAS